MDTGRVAAMLLALVMAQYAAGVNYCHYNAAGSGSWADKTRWENENVPQTGDVVRIGTAALPQAATARTRSQPPLRERDIRLFRLNKNL